MIYALDEILVKEAMTNVDMDHVVSNHIWYLLNRIGADYFNDDDWRSWIDYRFSDNDLQCG